MSRFSFLNFDKTDILIHASSCGEAKLCLPIIKKVKTLKINVKLSIHSCNGYNCIKKLSEPSFLKPFDTFICTFLLFIKLRPKIILISESDVWPIFILFSKFFKCKIFFINYKIKNKLFRTFFHSLIADKFYLLNDKKIENNKYSYLGDLKLLEKISPNKKCNKNKLIIVISSANQNEIELHIKYTKFIIENYKEIKIIYVPRYLDWIDNLKSKLKNIDHYFLKDLNDIYTSKKPLIICWKFGILNQIYKLSNICLMGDTFNNIGGHNLIEPSLNKNAILIGKNFQTCKNQVKFLKGLFICNNLDDLINKTNKLLKNKLYLNYGELNFDSVMNKRKIILKNFEKFILDLKIERLK